MYYICNCATQVTQFFSYEHFYVLFCRFYELDSDRDNRLSRENLLKYGDHALSSAIVDRIFEVIGILLLLHTAYCARIVLHVISTITAVLLICSVTIPVQLLRCTSRQCIYINLCF
jgi:hypothetical protein